jgi:hypothetical protein
VQILELTGAQLDLWVARCRGLQREIRGEYVMRRVAHRAWARYCPSVDWAVAGPIIEREKIVLNYSPDDNESEPWTAGIGDMEYDIRGETPLIAAMRCYVVSELGISESGELNDNFCPYCDSENDCEHLLLRIDLTFREFKGGALAAAVEEQWALIMEENSENADFDECEAFDNLLWDVILLADSERYWESDGGPGMSSNYQACYSKNAEAASVAVAKWISLRGKDRVVRLDEL